MRFIFGLLALLLSLSGEAHVVCSKAHPSSKSSTGLPVPLTSGYKEILRAYRDAWRDPAIYRPHKCHENVVRLFHYIKSVFPEAKSSDFQVYYITKPGGWIGSGYPLGFAVRQPRRYRSQGSDQWTFFAHHVVLEYKGFVLDLDNDASPRAYPQKVYFRRFFPTKKEIRNMPDARDADGRENIVTYIVPGESYLDQNISTIQAHWFHQRIFDSYAPRALSELMN